MTVNTIVKPSDIAHLMLVASIQDDSVATVTPVSKPFYTSNSLDNPLALVTKIRTRKLEPMTPERALGNITDEVLGLLCKSFARSPKAGPEMKKLMMSKEVADRKEGFVMFVTQQSNIFIAATNDCVSAPPKRHVKNPGSAARRSKTKKVLAIVVKTDKNAKKGGNKSSNKK